MKNTTRAFVLLILLSTSTQFASGQSAVMKGYGLSTFIYGLEENENVIPIQLGVANLRVPITAKDRSSVTIGTYLGAAVAFNLDSRYGASSAFGANLPVVIDYNLGRGATQDADGRVGLFVGGGLGINGLAGVDNLDGSAAAFAVGPLANLGFRFRLMNVEYTLRGSYLLNMTKADNVVGLTILYERSVSRATRGGGGRGYRFFRNQSNWRNGQSVMY